MVRLTAMVTISAPLAAMARRVSSMSLVLAGPGEQARAVGLAGDGEAVGCGGLCRHGVNLSVSEKHRINHLPPSDIPEALLLLAARTGSGGAGPRGGAGIDV